jgi:hypothetical protein
MRRVVSLLFASLLLTMLVAPVTAATPSRWHRVNPATVDQLAEHERLSCNVVKDEWRCLYDKHPEVQLGFAYDQTKGYFTGSVFDSVPTELPEIYGHVETVIYGTMTYFPVGAEPVAVTTFLMFTDGVGVAPLWVYWDGMFACPWYASFEAAHANSPESCLNITWP